MAENKKEIAFEEAIERLEKIVATLENGKAPLSDSLELFEEGVALVRQCTEELDAAEKRITEITVGDKNE